MHWIFLTTATAITAGVSVAAAAAATTVKYGTGGESPRWD